ncbi:hypothetical protein MTBPR1_70094 [Candidatus Terasakiella magnetica]|uniref:Uncharacterized protein n=1 Tax=Candidatus Terasakiella magnetica TaxID=1867952 RepID=A0A1C3RKH4_9PROT|nr:hypothetical protein [Candidatus Terasakiella magnetica]SCA57822.1 hypothetical protein MTBPR1_70094 [Candidatus Terasakiella magnetica]
MTSVAPPPPPPLPPTAGGAAPQLTVSVGGPASVQLSKMALDSLLTGIVKQSSQGGTTSLQTNLGLLQFKAPFTLPPNAQATFKLVQTQPAVQVQLTHINGKPIAPNTPAGRVNTVATQFMQGNAQTASLGGQSSQAGGAQLNVGATPATLLNLNTASGIKAFVLSPTTNQGQAQAGTTTGQAQTKANPTQSGKSSLAGVQVKSGATPTTTGSTVIQGQGTQATGSNHFQSGNQLNVRLLSVQQPGQSTSQIQSASSTPSTSTVITQGTVQGQTAQGQPIIKLPQGLIALDTTAKMQEGTLVKLEVLSSLKPSTKPATTNPTQPNQGPQNLAQKWPALEEAMATLKDINPALAENLSNALVPKADNRLAANMIFFLKALGRGTFKNWADEKTLKALGKFKPELLKRLEGDFSQMSDKAKAPNSTDWKIAYVPMQNNGEINQIRIAHRNPKEDEKDGKDDPGVRFVIDLDLSQLGPMQFDGLAKDRLKKFDLIVRTHSALPGFMRKEIHDIYDTGMKAIGFDGKITYQVTPHFVEVDGIELNKSELNLGMLV